MNIRLIVVAIIFLAIMILGNGGMIWGAWMMAAGAFVESRGDRNGLVESPLQIIGGFIILFGLMSLIGGTVFFFASY